MHSEGVGGELRWGFPSPSTTSSSPLLPLLPVPLPLLRTCSHLHMHNRSGGAESLGVFQTSTLSSQLGRMPSVPNTPSTWRQVALGVNEVSPSKLQTRGPARRSAPPHAQTCSLLRFSLNRREPAASLLGRSQTSVSPFPRAGSASQEPWTTHAAAAHRRAPAARRSLATDVPCPAVCKAPSGSRTVPEAHSPPSALPCGYPRATFYGHSPDRRVFPFFVFIEKKCTEPPYCKDRLPFSAFTRVGVRKCTWGSRRPS